MFENIDLVFETIVINNNNIVNKIKYFKILIDKKHFMFKIRINFNAISVINKVCINCQ